MPDILGRGLSFPLRLSDQQRLQMVSDDDDIRQAIYIILNTIPGERVMRPEFGCEIHSLIFHPANRQTATLAERYVREALNRWEPRIELRSVRVDPQPGDQGVLLINVVYRTREDYDYRNLVYPFYLLPE